LPKEKFGARNWKLEVLDTIPIFLGLKGFQRSFAGIILEKKKLKSAPSVDCRQCIVEFPFQQIILKKELKFNNFGPMQKPIYRRDHRRFTSGKNIIFGAIA